MTRRGTVSLTRQILSNTVSRLNPSVIYYQRKDPFSVRASFKVNCNEIIKLLERDNSVLILSALISEKARPFEFKITN